MKHDLIVIGSTPVATATAAEGSRLGFRTLLVQQPRGPAESSARLRHAFASRVVTERLASGKALQRNEWLRLTQQIESSEERYLRALEDELAASPIRSARGPARLLDASTVEIAGTRHHAGAVIVVAGTRARRPARFPFDDVTVFDACSIFRARRVSPSLLVVGASEDGCEIASFFGALGTSVLLLDRRTQLLRGFDRDLLRQVHVDLQSKGVEIVLDEEIASMRSRVQGSEPHVVIELASGRVEMPGITVVCAGLSPYREWIETDEFVLDADERGFVAADERGQTAHPGLYAVGDVAGMPHELPVQIQAARATVRQAAGLDPATEDHLPCTVHTIPELAFFGLSEEACQRLGTACVAGVVPYPPGAAKAADGNERAPHGGLLKMIVSRETREVLGVHAIGPRASETVYTAIALVRASAGVDRIAASLFPVPSASESIRLAACRAIARLPKLARAPADRAVAHFF